MLGAHVCIYSPSVQELKCEFIISGRLEELEVVLLNSSGPILPLVQPFSESVAKINVFKAKQRYAISMKLARIISQLSCLRRSCSIHHKEAS